ncbi:ligand-binding sensor domain-containing protein [Larkinella soli]|uniref:ligand-binding sensor domain-containing protein n=1 Tax=Larkinella soli TaxID=1770527 RepID=UPI000FFC5BD5|nr:two-component regulator propeller domain-containing protein [Larkinella soli]
MAGEVSLRAAVRVWLLLWLVGAAGSLHAQIRPDQFEFQHLQEKDGISFNMINCFLQDRDGFLWIGTFDGLNRYDGHRFTTFRRQRTDDQSLLNNTVHDLCEDRQGNLWMAVDNGISRYDKATGRFRNITAVDGHPLGFCSNILTDRRGNVWFTSERAGLHRYDARTGRIERFLLNKTGAPPTALHLTPKNGLLEDPTRNGLWIAQRHGLHYFDIDRRRFTGPADNPEQLPVFTGHYVSALALDGDRLIFADNDARRIVVYSLTRRRILKTMTPVSSREKRDVFEIATIFVDRQHNLWTSSWNYLLFHIAADTDRITELHHDEARPTSIAGSFFWAGWQHPDGSVWLGTVNGISITNPERAFYTVYNPGAQFPALNDERGIICFVEDPDGSWWLGTSIRGLLHYFPRTNRLDVYKLPNATPERPYGQVISALVPAGDTLYVAGETALYTFHKKRKTFSELPRPAPIRQQKARLWNILKEGRYLWASGESKRAFRYHIPTGQWESFPVVPTDDQGSFMLSTFLKDRQGALWVDLYPGGLARFSPERKAFLVDERSRDNPYENSVTSISEDRQGNFWMSTNGYGLLRYHPKSRRYTYWTQSEGLAYDHCLAALPDRFGNVWVGGFSKFSIFSPRTNRFVNFSLPYSPDNLEYVNQLFPLRNGHILGALKGYLVEFSPEKLADRPAFLPDRVLISQVSVGDSVWLNHRGLAGLDLKAGESGFTVHFGAITSASQAPFDYYYQLDGYEGWKPAGNDRYAVYSRLPGGNYTFRVKGVTADGRQTAIGTLPIHIDTYLHQKIWFRGLLVLLAVGLVVGFLRYRADQTERLHDLQVQATRLERDKTEIQYQNLINHLNPHFLFNSLTSLNSLIHIDPRQASTFLRKLSIIYRYILQNKDKELVTLEEELAFVQNYIDLQISRFDDALQIPTDVPAGFRTRLIVPVTIQNLLENAIKHNTIDEESPLVIRVYTEDDCLCVSNNLQRKSFVETSNKQGLVSLRSLYRYLGSRPIQVVETEAEFTVKVPLL